MDDVALVKEKARKQRSVLTGDAGDKGNFVDRLACPIILFQGLEDKVVPPNQSEMMAAAARAKGLPVTYLAFEGEQHGFRKADTIVRCLEAELYFYGRVFGFTPADRLPPVPIDNL